MMLKFIFRRIVQGGFVMAGVVVSVFCLFYVLPGDPARMIAGPHANEATIKAIRHDLGLDRPVLIQFLSYVNDVSPISIHKVDNEESLFYLDPDKYTPFIKLYSWGGSNDLQRSDEKKEY